MIRTWDVRDDRAWLIALRELNPEPLIKDKRDKERVSILSARIVEIHRGILDGSDGGEAGEEASCAQVDRNEASDIKLAPVPVDISIYLYLLTSNMCNVPAPLRRRHNGGTGTPPFSRLRCSAARARVRVVRRLPSPPASPSSSPSNPRRWCNTQRLLCDITRPRASVPTSVLLSPMTIKTDTTNAGRANWASGISTETHKF